MQECTKSINRLIFCNLYSFLQIFGGYFWYRCRFLEVIFVSNADFWKFLSSKYCGQRILNKHIKRQLSYYNISNASKLLRCLFYYWFYVLLHIRVVWLSWICDRKSLFFSVDNFEAEEFSFYVVFMVDNYYCMNMVWHSVPKFCFDFYKRSCVCYNTDFIFTYVLYVCKNFFRKNEK